MICPKCGFEQPESAECMRCGVVVGRYKGPVVESASGSFSPPEPPPPAAAGTFYGGPVPAMAGVVSGTVYEGPAPGSGTVYQGPDAASSVRRPSAPVGYRGALGVGQVLGQTFTVYFRNFLPFALLTTVVLAPLLVAQAFMTSSSSSKNLAVMLPSALLTLIGSIVCPYLATSAITYGVFQQMRRQDTSIADCLARGFSAFLPVLGLAIVQGLVIGLGLIACIIPGILLMVRWAVSVPASVEERADIGEAMNRSTYLTDGYRWEVFQVLFVLGVLNLGSAVLVAVAADWNPTFSLILSGVQSVLAVGLSATGTAVMYYRLRSLKESIDVDQIASVFN